MGVLPDWLIQRDIKIEPFEPSALRPGIISYGVSSYGYDVRVGRKFKVFTNVHCKIVDPKQFDPASFIDIEADHCLIPPNSFALAETVEYLEIPRDIISICLGKSTYARCFTADTRVALADGTSPTLVEMARGADAGHTYRGYSIGREGDLIETTLEAPRFIGRDSLVEVTLDHGARIRCTPDHTFMLADRRMIRADQLCPGDALLSLCRSTNQGRALVRQPAPARPVPGRWHARDANLRRRSTVNRLQGHWNRVTPEDARLPSLDADQHLNVRFLASQAAHRSGPGRTSQRSRVLRSALERGRFLPPGGQAPTASLARHTRVVSVKALRGEHDVYCLTVPEAGNFALDAGVLVSNCGIIVNVTPLEPEWRGKVTIEISNTTPLPAKIYAGEGIAQILFLRGEAVCQTSYGDKRGKYQDQKGLTLPFVQGADPGATPGG